MNAYHKLSTKEIKGNFLCSLRTFMKKIQVEDITLGPYLLNIQYTNPKERHLDRSREMIYCVCAPIFLCDQYYF